MLYASAISYKFIQMYFNVGNGNWLNVKQTHEVLKGMLINNLNKIIPLLPNPNLRIRKNF